MIYRQQLFLRLILALVIAFSYKVLYLIIAPMTFYFSYLMLKPFYHPEILEGAMRVDSTILNFVPACYALLAYLLLALLIVFTKDIGLVKGVKMFVLGSFIILVANLIRIFIIVFVLVEKGVNYFNTLHLVTWKIISTVFVVVLWILLCKEFKVKTIPVYSDLKALVSKMKD